MRISECSSLILVFIGLLLVAPVVGQKQLAQSPRILSAKTVYFNNQTGSDAVGKNAVAQLKKWGRFQLVSDRKQADLIFLLSADPYKGGNIIFASGQTGSTESGHVNFPSTFLIAPGEHQVYAIRLDQWWETHPSLPKTDETNITLKAIYEVPPTPEAAQYRVWTGRLESRTYDVKLRQW